MLTCVIKWKWFILKFPLKTTLDQPKRYYVTSIFNNKSTITCMLWITRDIWSFKMLSKIVFQLKQTRKTQIPNSISALSELCACIFKKKVFLFLLRIKLFFFLFPRYWNVFMHCIKWWQIQTKNKFKQNNASS